MEQAILSNPRCRWGNWHWDVEQYLFKIIQLMSLSPRIQVFQDSKFHPVLIAQRASLPVTQKGSFLGGVVSFHCLHFPISQIPFRNSSLDSSSLLPCIWSYPAHQSPHPVVHLCSYLTRPSVAFKMTTPSLKPCPFLASIKNRLLVSLLLQ